MFSKYYLSKCIILIIGILFVNSPVKAQPYICYYKEKPDTTGNYNYDSDIHSINLSDNSVAVLLRDQGETNLVKCDPTQTWLLINSKLGSSIINLSDKSKFYVLFDDQVDIGGFLFSKKNNKIYVFWAPLDSLIEYLSIYKFDGYGMTLEGEIQLPYFYEDRNQLNEESFFSDDEKMIYFTERDELTRKKQILGFSTTTNSIEYRRNLLEIAQESKFQILEGGSKGKAIISFRYPTQKKSIINYIVYDINLDKSSPIIIAPVNTQAHLSSDANYLITEQVNTDGKNETRPGNISVYRVSSGKLIKQLTYPPEGKVYMFDEFPTMFYYYLPTEKSINPVNISKLIPNYNLNITISGNGIVKRIPELASYDSSTVVTLEALADQGSILRDWSGDIKNTDNTLNVLMDSDKNITATFVLKPHITALSPAYAVVGTDDIQINIKGRGFTGNSSVIWNKQTRTTGFISDSLLQTTVLKSDLQTKEDIEVKTEDYNGINSNSVTFSVISKAEALDSLSLVLNSSCGKNLIKSKGICNSLQTKLDNMRKDLEKGNMRSAKGTLQAFSHEIDAQKNKSVSLEIYYRLNYYVQLILKSF
ncbi:MAG: InlB B-repeat-containing protein [Clostridiales bacterium]